MNLKYYWPIIGHSKIKQYLKNQVENDNLTHAMIFLGPKNIGKRTMAELFAKSLLCESKEKKPCGNCPKCKQASNGTSGDYIFIKKLEDNKNISIKQILELQQKLSLKSFNANYKCIIIDNAEELSEKANNALLKTLEEPHEKTIFILIASHAKHLPSTIISRCQEIYFNLVPEYKIQNWLIAKKINKLDAKNIASFSLGRPGLACQYIKDDDKLSQIQEMSKLIVKTMRPQSITNRLNLMTDYLKKGLSIDEYQKLLSIWETVIRDYYIVRYNNNITNRKLMTVIKSEYKKFNNRKLLKLNESITEAKLLINKSINPVLVLENFLINL